MLTPHSTMTVNVLFQHVIPDNEHISQQVYLQCVQHVLSNIFQIGSFQPSVLANAIHATVDDFDDPNYLGFTQDFDELYGCLSRFLEDFLFCATNKEALYSLTTFSGQGDAYEIQQCGQFTSIILLVNTPINLIKN